MKLHGAVLHLLLVLLYSRGASGRRALNNVTAAATAEIQQHAQEPAYVKPPVPATEVTPNTKPSELHGDVYRPFHTRYEVKASEQAHIVGTDGKPLMAENRKAYREFRANRLNHPQVPNSVDHNAESSAACVFLFAGLVLVFGGFLAYDRAQQLPAEKHLPLAFTALIAPWLITTAYSLQVATAHYGAASRGTEYCWECDGLVWFLLLFPFLSAMTAGLHLVALSPGFLNLPDPSLDGERAMGRMFDTSFMSDVRPGQKMLHRLVLFCSEPAVRGVTFVGVVIMGLLGCGLCVFTYGGSYRCQPDVWYTSVTLSACISLLAMLSLFSYLGSLFVMQVAGVAWIQDFVDSFRREDVRTKGEKQMYT